LLYSSGHCQSRVEFAWRTLKFLYNKERILEEYHVGKILGNKHSGFS
jgi:hypothetical protein